MLRTILSVQHQTNSRAVWDSGMQALAYRKRSVLGEGYRIQGGQATVEREEWDIDTPL